MPLVTLALPSLRNDIFCKCVTRLFGLMVRVKMNATVLEALPSVIERGSQNVNGVRVKDLCRVRDRVSAEILLHGAPPHRAALRRDDRGVELPANKGQAA
jgi:hypothetical protein